jgi:GDP-mannose pyrophosphatase NudK
VTEGGGLHEEQEYINIMELPLQKAINLMNSGQIRDAKTIILLQYAIINRLVSD